MRNFGSPMYFQVAKSHFIDNQPYFSKKMIIRKEVRNPLIVVRKLRTRWRKSQRTSQNLLKTTEPKALKESISVNYMSLDLI